MQCKALHCASLRIFEGKFAYLHTFLRSFIEPRPFILKIFNFNNLYLDNGNCSCLILLFFFFNLKNQNQDYLIPPSYTSCLPEVFSLSYPLAQGACQQNWTSLVDSHGIWFDLHRHEQTRSRPEQRIALHWVALEQGGKSRQKKWRKNEIRNNKTNQLSALICEW